KFIPTPLLDVFGIIAKGLAGCSKAGTLQLNSAVRVLVGGQTPSGYFIVFANLSESPTTVEFEGKADVHAIFGGLGARTIPLGSTSIQPSEIRTAVLSATSSGGFTLPPFAIAFTSVESGRLNGIPLSDAIIGYHAVKNGRELNLGEFGVRLTNGRLRIFPTGCRVYGRDLRLIPLSRVQLERSLGTNITSVSDWSISELETET
ncbi:MAG TPA: hypothetical protein V6C65_07260, partial [Allocoleopsis sp.]